ncbi:MAG: histidine kinase dimerization/phospho-acceptor domain-containing protein, partial [Limnobacter sp.]|nr:histidine kinase dimerization/phospho-acceptor domain-containing protein [Limnobacter sp.]
MTNNFSAFMPHGYCISWDPFLLGLHLSSDALIALAYFSIPFGILYLVHQKKDLSFKPVYYLFAGFILACGVTHVLGMVTLWIPMYYIQGWMKAVTALVSVATAVYLLPKLPQILALPDLQETLNLNSSLKKEAESRRIAEEQLAQSQIQLKQTNRLLSQVLDSIPQRVYWKNRNLEFLGANGSFLEDFDLNNTNQLIGRKQASENQESTYALDPTLERQVMATGQPMLNREICLDPASNPPLWIRLSLVPLLDDDEQNMGLMGTYQDVSKRKEAEGKLQNANDTANAALRTQAAFLANISHEVRTPISGVIGSLNLLAESPLDPHQADLVLGAKLSSESMLELLNDILDLSKIESNQFELSLSEVYLEHLLHQVAKNFEVIAENKKISLVCPSNALPQDVFLADRTRLRQVLSNLVSNAIKFTSSGHVQVQVECLETSSFESELRFSVRDTGM